MLEDFDLVKLLHMDKKYFSEKIWVHMFYTPPDDFWRWKMNVARVMGNTLEIKYIPELIRAFKENNDERVKGMCAWALGRLGGDESKTFLEEFLKDSDGLVKEEVSAALNNFNS
jgi:epoxyqueuosine reductase